MSTLISIQLNGKDNIDSNLAAITQLVEKACEKADLPRLVVLPECCSIFGVKGQAMLETAEVLGEGKVQKQLQSIAIENQCFLVAGTIPILSLDEPNKFTAASLVYAPDGELISRYNKMHLFDADVADATSSYRESVSTVAGDKVCVFDSPFGAIGQTVCYDLRFAGLFLAMTQHSKFNQAPHVIVVPSAFTKTTGKAHWHALLQARSIENQCFVVASNQTGKHSDGRETFGNSCIYSPWGECLSLLEEGEGYITATYDEAQINQIRMQMPIHAHKKERYQVES